MVGRALVAPHPILVTTRADVAVADRPVGVEAVDIP